MSFDVSGEPVVVFGLWPYRFSFVFSVGLWT